MAWPTHQVNGFVPSSTEWNAIVDALSVAQGSYNGNGQTAAGWLKMTINPSVSSDALMVYTPLLVSAGTAASGNLVIRANSYDTSNHTRDFAFAVGTTSNAGAGYLGIYTRLDGAGYSQLLTVTSAGAVGVGIIPVGTPNFITHCGTNLNLAIDYAPSLQTGAVRLVAVNDAYTAEIPLTLDATSFTFRNSASVMAVLDSNGLDLVAISAPGTPAASNFRIYMDVADNKLKCKGPSGTVTILGLP